MLAGGLPCYRGTGREVPWSRTAVRRSWRSGRAATWSVRRGIDGSPRSATVTTCGHAVAYQIKGPVLVDFLRQRPEAALTLSRMAIERLRWANQLRPI